MFSLQFVVAVMTNHCTIGKMYVKDLNIVTCACVNPNLMTCHLYCVHYGHTRCTESIVHALYGIIVIICIICALVSQPLKCGVQISSSSASEEVRKDRSCWVRSQKWLKILTILANYIVFLWRLLYIVCSFIFLSYLHFVTHSVSLNGLTAVESAL